MARVYYPKKKSTAPAAPAPVAAKVKKATKKKARKQQQQQQPFPRLVRDSVADGVKSDYLTDVSFAPSALAALEKASDEYLEGLINGGELPKRKQSRAAPKKPQLARRLRGERA